MSGAYSEVNFGGQRRGVGIAFSFGDQVLLQHLAKLAARQQFGAARREIGEYLVGEIQDNLDGQRLADGSPMPQSKAALARDGKTLIERHHLYDSYVYQLVPRGLEVGSALVYARIHHFGGQAGRGRKVRIEPRPVMGIGPAQERRIGDILINELRGLQ